MVDLLVWISQEAVYEVSYDENGNLTVNGVTSFPSSLNFQVCLLSDYDDQSNVITYLQIVLFNRKTPRSDTR